MQGFDSFISKLSIPGSESDLVRICLAKLAAKLVVKVSSPTDVEKVTIIILPAVKGFITISVEIDFPRRDENV